MRRLSSASLLSLSLALSSSCTVDHDLQGPAPNRPRALAVERPLDVLFVVDNSGSMQDEHAQLSRSVFNEACPIVDVSNVPEPYRNPDRQTFDDLAAVCGLSQLLAAMNGDFHLGVITTDVGMFDERLSSAQDSSGTHEQTTMRGCLQGPGVITGDDDIAKTFADAMVGVGTYGSPIERGMDAVEVFLDPDSRRAPGCENDLDGFLRKDGRLVVVFVTDEDDCSHRDGATGFPNELENEPQGPGDFLDLFTRYRTQDCYARVDELATVQSYHDMLARLVLAGRTSDVLVSVIGGAVDVAGSMEAAGCIATDDGSVSDECTEAFGTGNGGACAGANCCSADSADRYIKLARQMNADSLVGSICSTSFLDVVLPLFRQSELGGEEVF
jgi:hypothetical protein